MGTLSYAMSTSLDGYVEDTAGSIAFSAPDEEVHRFANQQTRETAAFLFGRGLYEVMEEFWTAPERADGADVEAEFAREYAATPRIVFSDTLPPWRPAAAWCAAPTRSTRWCGSRRRPTASWPWAAPAWPRRCWT